jgi:hypothetical protein
MITEGKSRSLVEKTLNIKKGTLHNWIRKERWSNPESVPAPQPQNVLRLGKVKTVRSVLSMVDDGTSLHEITRRTGIDRQTVRRWRDDPRYREATYEYDELFPYDEDDLVDRSIVAQHLCTQTPDPWERLALLMAVVGLDPPVMDDNSVGFKPRYNSRIRQASINQDGRK